MVADPPDGVASWPASAQPLRALDPLTHGLLGAGLGYAAFGHVVGGMDTVRRILAKPTGGGLDAFKGQMILNRVALISAKRLDGTPRPTSGPRPWLLKTRPTPPRPR